LTGNKLALLYTAAFSNSVNSSCTTKGKLQLGPFHIAQQTIMNTSWFSAMQDSQPHEARCEPLQLAANHHSAAVAAARLGTVVVP
jgi:hypothetical protein